MSNAFTVKMRLKILEASLKALDEYVTKLADVCRSRTDDLRLAHNALVQALQKALPPVEAAPVAPQAESDTKEVLA